MTTNLICNASLFTKGCISLEGDNVHDFTFSFTKLSESLPALSKSGKFLMVGLRRPIFLSDNRNQLCRMSNRQMTSCLPQLSKLLCN